MRVADILKTKGTVVFSVREDDSIATAVSELHKNRIGALVVLDGTDHISGIISERDLARGLAEHGDRLLTMKVNELMTHHLYLCKPDDTIKKVMTWMTNYRIRHLPVLENGKLAGLVSIGDVVRHRLHEVETEANVLRDIVVART